MKTEYFAALMMAWGIVLQILGLTAERGKPAREHLITRGTLWIVGGIVLARLAEISLQR